MKERKEEVKRIVEEEELEVVKEKKEAKRIVEDEEGE